MTEFEKNYPSLAEDLCFYWKYANNTDVVVGWVIGVRAALLFSGDMACDDLLGLEKLVRAVRN